MDNNQKQTQSTFGFKWKNKKDTFWSEATRQKTLKWLIKRYFGTQEDFEEQIPNFQNKSLLDAGCGNGHSASILFAKHLANMDYLGVDIADDAIQTAKKRFKELGLSGNFITDNIQTLKLNKQFDYIFSEGVIHHTSNPEETFNTLVSHLKSEGKIMFYVYKKKAPIREFTDDYVREKIKGISNEET